MLTKLIIKKLYNIVKITYLLDICYNIYYILIKIDITRIYFSFKSIRYFIFITPLFF